MPHLRRALAPLAALPLLAAPAPVQTPAPAIPAKDPHSFARPEEARTRHLHLDLSVDFAAKQLRGSATWDLWRAKPGEAQTLVLDTRSLSIEKVETSADGKAWKATTFEVGKADAVLGSSLSVALPAGAKKVRIAYRTAPEASGLQWLTPAQTTGKRQPFLFSQSEAIHARSWVPCQDSPGVRVTYDAVIHTPKDLRAVMSAEQALGGPRTGTYRFRMPQAIPPYLLALAVGDLDFQALGKRSGVFAEPPVLAKAAKELEDTEKMIATTERLFGPYRWGRYDILMLPPSFPFGGMENPRLTFATPTILAGDKSLVSLVAHELAHSWSGNLVTNATWRDVWLNEGFTTYVERRIVEAVYGRGAEEMQALLGRHTLDRLLRELPPGDTVLHLQLGDRDPDEALSEIPYEKGTLFLRTVEETVGRADFDRWLRGYFDRHAFRSITTADFLQDLQEHLLKAHPEAARKLDLQAWIEQPGVPPGAAVPQSDAFAKVEAQAQGFLRGEKRAEDLSGKAWTTQEWLHFLQVLPPDLGPEAMKALDAAWRLTDTGNAEIAHQWLLIAIRRGYAPADARLEQYLTGIGRRKLIVPLYAELAKTPEGKARARKIYAQARPGYHPIAQTTLDQLLK